MIRLAFLASIVIALPMSAAASGDVPLPAEYTACIEQNAAAVERLGEPMRASVDFLASSLCAEPLDAFADARLAAGKAKREEASRKMCEQMKAAAKTDEDRAKIEAGCENGAYDPYMMMEGYELRIPSAAPAAAEALAARLLLDLRTKRLDAAPPQ